MSSRRRGALNTNFVDPHSRCLMDMSRLWWFEQMDDWVWNHIDAQPWLLERIERNVRGKLRALPAGGDWADYNWGDGLRYVKGTGYEVID
jgi:hypothetical protein